MLWDVQSTATQIRSLFRKAFQPAVASMAQTLLAASYGSGELTKTDIDQIATVLNTICEDAPKWSKAEASTIATRTTQEVYAALAQRNQIT